MPCTRSLLPIRHAVVCGAIVCLAGLPDRADAGYACSLAPRDVDLITSTTASSSTSRPLTLTCTRASSDANTLTYTIGADPGLNSAAGQRRVRLVGTRIAYQLNRATTLTGLPSCLTGSSNWTTSSPNLISGTLSFGSSLTTQATWQFCASMLSTPSQPAGVYTDTVMLTATYPATGPLRQSASAPLSVEAGIRTACLIVIPSAAIALNYTANGPTVANARNIGFACNTGVAWTAGLLNPASPAAPKVTTLNGQSLLGLTYSLTVSPVSGTGNGNNLTPQNVSVTATVPGGQWGTCATATCTGSTTHTLVIEY